MLKTSEMNEIRILLIEDNRLLRDGLTTMLNRQEDMEVAAAFGQEDDVVTEARQLKPQVVLLNLESQSHKSLRLVEEIKKESPTAKVVITGLLPTQKELVDFVHAGVSGFLLKEATFDDFLKTIRSVAEGGSVLPPVLTGPLFSQVAEETTTTSRSRVHELVRLTKREKEIIELIAEGLSNKEVAQMLNIATHTVKSHVHNILEKLTLHTRVQIAAYIRPRGPLRSRSANTQQPDD